jgi:hypothetical protein
VRALAQKEIRIIRSSSFRALISLNTWLISSSLISSLMGMDLPFGEPIASCGVGVHRRSINPDAAEYSIPLGGLGGFLMAIMAIMAGLGTVTVYTGPTAREG